MIAALLMHILRVFFTGAFRRPRQLQWFALIALLVVPASLWWARAGARRLRGEHLLLCDADIEQDGRALVHAVATFAVLDK